MQLPAPLALLLWALAPFTALLLVAGLVAELRGMARERRLRRHRTTSQAATATGGRGVAVAAALSLVAPWVWITTFLVRRPDSVVDAVVQFLTVTAGLGAVVALVTSRRRRAQPVEPLYRIDTAVLIATKDGAATIGDAVASAVGQCPVYVVSDGSTDATAAEAAWHGAHVVELPENRGKPAALRALLDRRFRHLGHKRLADSYRNLIVIDDDTTLAPGFVDRIAARLAPAGVAAVGGQVASAWPRRGRLSWNPWVAARSWSTWRTQFLLLRGQSALGVRQYISGASTGYRAEILDEVLTAATPYIVDDTYWCREIQRLGLGRIEFEPRALATVQEPTDMRALYRQDLRWAWGGWQGVFGHRIGLRRSRVDVGFWLGLADLVLYVAAWPLLLVVSVANGIPVPTAIGLYLAGYAACGVVAAVVCANWRLLVLWPAFVAYDWLYRVVVIHGLLKALRQPTVERCTWVSPARYVEEPVPSTTR